MTTQQYPITLSEFREWLETKRPRAVVGLRLHGQKCPIGTYLTARGDEFAVVVSSDIWAKAGGCKRTPQWAHDFIRLVDNSGGFLSPIRAGTALRLLDRAAHASLPEDEEDHERTALESEALT